ncbi:hypothetical protein [Treponema pectinovorum]|uniref:hypothetical protein n=1 Tax=Treponema pectinovorum TaxID=164 RepID=UPI0011C711F9|nr:hypothetical protein [Treponema pectinovorum]
MADFYVCRNFMRKTVFFHVFCSLLLLFACFDSSVKKTAKITSDNYVELVSVPENDETLLILPTIKDTKIVDRQNFRSWDNIPDFISLKEKPFTKNSIFIGIKKFDSFIPLSLNKFLTFLITEQTFA